MSHPLHLHQQNEQSSGSGCLRFLQTTAHSGSKALLSFSKARREDKDKGHVLWYNDNGKKWED